MTREILVAIAAAGIAAAWFWPSLVAEFQTVSTDDAFVAEKRGAGMAVYGMAALIAPVLGPTLGGWITDNYSWRWIFYINIPAGLLALVMNSLFVEDPDYLKADRATNLKRGLNIDAIGIGLFAVGLGSLEVVLDKGEQWDWFGSRLIVALSVFCVVGLIGGAIWELRHPRPFLNLRALGERNFACACAMIFIAYGVLYGTILLLPRMLQRMISRRSNQGRLS